jgi:hypothetical protein
MESGFFAGKKFTVSKYDGVDYLLWETFTYPFGIAGGAFPAMLPEVIDGSFLVWLEEKQGWLLVAGARRFQKVRHTFFDDSSESKSNALSICTFGVPVLSLEDGQLNVNMASVPLCPVTILERKQDMPPWEESSDEFTVAVMKMSLPRARG